jgi:TonB family protein
MDRFHMGDRPLRLRWVEAKICQAVVFALILALTLPARAADERAVKSRVAPVYPEIAKRLRIAGAVKLAATVNAQGKVTDVKALSGNSMIAVAAEDAVRQWRFAPGPEETNVNLEINFAVGQ